MESYLRVRRAVMVDGMSIREASRVFGLHRDTVRKMLAYSAPPGYRRQTSPKRPKLEPFTGVIDGILEEDLKLPRKQRHTAKRIYERLRDEHGFDGGYTIVKDYVRERRRQSQEMFVPLFHPPGHAQCDFGEALVIIGGVEQKAHCFVLDLPHSDGCFMKAYPAQTTEAFLDGHVSAFAYLMHFPPISSSHQSPTTHLCNNTIALIKPHATIATNNTNKRLKTVVKNQPSSSSDARPSSSASPSGSPPSGGTRTPRNSSYTARSNSRTATISFSLKRLR